MADGSERPTDEHEERPRPRVVDKRVSSRSEAPADAQSPAPEPPRREPPAAKPAPQAPASAGAGAADDAREPLWTPEQEAEARRFAQEVVETPSRDWVLNTAVTLANVAATKLDAGRAEDAHLAIDALAALVGGVGSRLGDAEAPLRQTLAQLQMAFAQGTSGTAPGARPEPG